MECDLAHHHDLFMAKYDDHYFCEWYWSDKYNCWERYRELPDGTVEYDYKSEPQTFPQVASPLEGPAPYSQWPIQSSQGQSDFNQAASGFASPYGGQVLTSHQAIRYESVGTPRQESSNPASSFRSSAVDNLGHHLAKTQLDNTHHDDTSVPRSLPSTQLSMYPDTGINKRMVKTRDPSQTVDALDTRYKVHHSDEFEFGKIFKVLWSEPRGSRGTVITEIRPSRHESFQKIRRFVIVSERDGHCICLPILTYGGQGLLKNGVHSSDHALIYSGSNPTTFEGEVITRDNIHCKMNGKSEKLDPASRMNYAKLYTVEHNVKVWFIGRVSGSHEQRLVTGYNDVHPLLPNRPAAAGRVDDNIDPISEEAYIYHREVERDEDGNEIPRHPHPADPEPPAIAAGGRHSERHNRSRKDKDKIRKK